MALAQPGVEVAVLEVARGGILLKGIGTAHADVAVVTNVSADHLGLHGIFTLDQLAEVKASITRIVRPDGWCVLNADDPRVLAMRRTARGRPFLFSMDPDHPALRSVLAEGGRANLFEVDGRVVVIDYAHNEAGMQGLVQICRGLRAPGATVWIAFGSAGDRSDEIMHAVGYEAARGADRVAVVELPRYLRGRDPREVVERLRAGAVDGGASEGPDFPDEVAG